MKYIEVFIVIVFLALCVYVWTSRYAYQKEIDRANDRSQRLQEREDARQAFLREYAVDAQGNWHKITVKGVR